MELLYLVRYTAKIIKNTLICKTKVIFKYKQYFFLPIKKCFFNLVFRLVYILKQLIYREQMLTWFKLNWFEVVQLHFQL